MKLNCVGGKMILVVALVCQVVHGIDGFEQIIVEKNLARFACLRFVADELELSDKQLRELKIFREEHLTEYKEFKKELGKYNPPEDVRLRRFRKLQTSCRDRFREILIGHQLKRLDQLLVWIAITWKHGRFDRFKNPLLLKELEVTLEAQKEIEAIVAKSSEEFEQEVKHAIFSSPGEIISKVLSKEQVEIYGALFPKHSSPSKPNHDVLRKVNLTKIPVDFDPFDSINSIVLSKASATPAQIERVEELFKRYHKEASDWQMANKGYLQSELVRRHKALNSKYGRVLEDMLSAEQIQTLYLLRFERLYTRNGPIEVLKHHEVRPRIGIGDHQLKDIEKALEQRDEKLDEITREKSLACLEGVKSVLSPKQRRKFNSLLGDIPKAFLRYSPRWWKEEVE